MSFRTLEYFFAFCKKKIGSGLGLWGLILCLLPLRAYKFRRFPLVDNGGKIFFDCLFKSGIGGLCRRLSMLMRFLRMAWVGVGVSKKRLISIKAGFIRLLSVFLLNIDYVYNICRQFYCFE